MDVSMKGGQSVQRSTGDGYVNPNLWSGPAAIKLFGSREFVTSAFLQNSF